MSIEEMQKWVLEEFERVSGIHGDYAYPVNQNQWMIMVGHEDQYIMTLE